MAHHFKPFRISWRIGLLLLHIFTGLILAVIFLRKVVPPGSLAATLNLWWHQRVCNIFAMHKTVHGRINQQPTLFVINHISWFDIPSLGACVPVHFLSKDEINSWPLIGWLAKKVGTLFIKRGGKGAAEQSIKDIRQALQQGGHVIVFPEGTTTDGTSLGHFHSRLFQAAIDARVQIQPVALRYPHADGVHPKAAFIGDTQFIDSLLGMISEKSMRVRLDFLTPINAWEYKRDKLTELARQQILTIITDKKN
jgi:1-acyl-sn-glycerol-3-phosphate acyltransferase